MSLKTITPQVRGKKKVNTLCYMPEGNRAIKKREKKRKKIVWKNLFRGLGACYFDCHLQMRKDVDKWHAGI